MERQRWGYVELAGVDGFDAGDEFRTARGFIEAPPRSRAQRLRDLLRIGVPDEIDNPRTFTTADNCLNSFDEACRGPATEQHEVGFKFDRQMFGVVSGRPLPDDRDGRLRRQGRRDATSKQR